MPDPCRIDIQRGNPVRVVDNYGHLIGVLNSDGLTWSLSVQDPRFTFTGGSLNVNLPGSGQGIVIWNSVSPVASYTPTLVTSYSVPVGKTFYLSRVESSGENKAIYWVEVDGIVKGRKRAYYPDFNVDFNFDSIPVDAGKIIRVYTEHTRPSTSTHDSNIQGQLI